MTDFVDAMNELSIDELKLLIAQAERLIAVKEEELERERLEKERLEKERLERERLERERLEKERLERERQRQEEIRMLEQRIKELQQEEQAAKEINNTNAQVAYYSTANFQPVQSTGQSANQNAVRSQPAQNTNQIHCPNCNGEIAAESSFCCYCGIRIKNAPNATPVAAPVNTPDATPVAAPVNTPDAAPVSVPVILPASTLSTPDAPPVNSPVASNAAPASTPVATKAAPAAAVNVAPVSTPPQQTANQSTLKAEASGVSVRYIDESEKKWTQLPGETEFGKWHEITMLKPERTSKYVYYINMSNKRFVFSRESRMKASAKVGAFGVLGSSLMFAKGKPWLEIPCECVKKIWMEGKNQISIEADQVYSFSGFSLKKIYEAMILRVPDAVK